MTDALLLARVTASLVVVVVLALVAARFARRTGVGGRHGAAEVRVLERVGLSREAAAVVVEVDGRRLLLGVSPAGVSLLADLGDRAPGAHVVVASEPPVASVTAVPAPRTELVGGATVSVAPMPMPMSRKAMRQVGQAADRRRKAMPPTQRGSGSVLDPRTWQQAVEALRDLTARRG